MSDKEKQTEVLKKALSEHGLMLSDEILGKVVDSLNEASAAAEKTEEPVVEKKEEPQQPKKKPDFVPAPLKLKKSQNKEGDWFAGTSWGKD